MWEWMEGFVRSYGYMGAFFISIFGNFTIFFPVPFTITIYAFGATLDPLILGVVCGLGSTIGEFSAYLVGRGDSRKNFNRPKWQYAMAVGNRHTGAPFRNPPKNYWPVINTIGVRENRNRKVVILTSFVQYALHLEMGGLGPGYLLTQAPSFSLGHLITRLSFAILKALRESG